MKSLLAAGALALALLPCAAGAAPANPMTGLFAQGAALSNAFELDEARIMVEDSTNPTLRAFAERMLHDHGQAQRELRQAGRAADVTTDFVLDGVQQKKVDDLGLMDGAKLDQTYIDDQVAAHASAAASLRSYAATGSDPALVAYARRTLPVVLMHQRMLAAITGRPNPL